MRTLSQKMGIRECSRSILINAMDETIANINLPEIDNQTTLNCEFILRSTQDFMAEVSGLVTGRADAANVYYINSQYVISKASQRRFRK